MQKTIEQYTSILRSTKPRHSRYFLYYNCMIALIGIAHQMWFVDFQQPLTEWPISFFVTVFGFPFFLQACRLSYFIWIPEWCILRMNIFRFFKKHIYGVTSNIVIRENRRTFGRYISVAGISHIHFFFTKQHYKYGGNSTETIHEKSARFKYIFQQIKKHNIDIYYEIRFKPLQEERRKKLFQEIEAYTPRLSSVDMWVIFLYELSFKLFFAYYILFGFSCLWNLIADKNL